MADKQKRLSEAWADLADQEVAPLAEGRTAEIAARDAKRDRKRIPYEDRRTLRRFTATCATSSTPRQVRRVCKEEGFIDEEGQGVITSSVVETLVLAGAQVYETGKLELPSKQNDDRAKRRIDVTCQSDETPDLLRRICRELGYLNTKGEPMISSRVVEELIQAGIDAYDRGEVSVSQDEDS